MVDVRLEERKKHYKNETQQPFSGVATRLLLNQDSLDVYDQVKNQLNKKMYGSNQEQNQFLLIIY